MDDSAHPEALARYLDLVRSLPAVRAAKRKSFSLLTVQPGDRVLDVGCGTGGDVLELADVVGPSGRVVGVDSSKVLIERALAAPAARRPGVEFLSADATELPFASVSFDRCRSDRTLQHVAVPERALAEMARVTKPGGTVVISEMINSLELADNADPGVRLLLGELWTDGERRGWIGPYLPLLLANAGFGDVGLSRERARCTSFEDTAVILNFRALCSAAVERGTLEAKDAEASLIRLERSFKDGRGALVSDFWHVTAIRG